MASNGCGRCWPNSSLQPHPKRRCDGQARGPVRFQRRLGHLGLRRYLSRVPCGGADRHSNRVQVRCRGLKRHPNRVYQGPEWHLNAVRSQESERHLCRGLE
ncbi:hypothetical protein SAMN05421543_10717 [Alicyclobacillus macrosporangiidus]|uniref:Uncharacterized protein n=1 Tax=Alicyclobacillus macrosporangiidus TaxID=392015 RepID=A0A1I7IPE4_9BACL|nr:hypothetical protein SAMN05421543_10717 [Alicyclobacillus macrosporangiidus]